MKWIALSVSVSLMAISIVPALSYALDRDSSIWVETCGGNTLKIDLPNDGDTPPIPPHTLKICHALCCSRQMIVSEGDEAA